MEGKPTWFNVKQDVLNWQGMCEANNNLAEFKADLQKLYDGRMIWVTTGIVASLEAGVTDSTHRVIEQQDMQTQVVTYNQQELQVDANAYIFRRLGFTDGEVLAMLV
jgi:hypothetical protein